MTSTKNNARLALQAQVASWYYEDGEGLTAIAKRIGRSPSLVSRMLQTARSTGLVEIRVNYPRMTDVALEEELVRRFRLKKALVLVTSGLRDERTLLRHFGDAGAEYLYEDLQAAPIIGTTWGAHVHAIVSSLRPAKNGEGIVVQTSGSIDTGDVTVDGAQLAQVLAGKLGKAVRTLHAPLFVESEHVADALRNSRSIAETLSLSSKAQCLLIGVGSPSAPNAGLVRAGYLNADDLADVVRHGGVGDIAGYHINTDGEVLDIPLNRRVVGLHPDVMRKIPNVIVAATGKSKVVPLLAALQGGYIKTLVTDSETAAGILQAHQPHLRTRKKR